MTATENKISTALTSTPSNLTGFHISVHVGFWNGKKSNDKNEYRTKKGDNIAAKTAPVQSYIIAMDHLNPVINISQKLRKNLDSPLHSLQVQYEGNTEGEGIGQGRRIKSRIVPRHRLVAWFQRHQQLVAEYDKAVQDFLAHYNEDIERARPALEKDGIFDENDYPSDEDLASKFYVEVDIRPANWDIDLSQSITKIAAESGKAEADVLKQLVAQEQLKHAQRVNTLGDKMAAALASNMKEILDGMTKILQAKADGERSRLTLKRAQDFVEFFNAVKALNVAGNPALDRVAQNILDTLEDAGLADAEDFIAGVQDNASQVLDTLKDNIVEVDDVFDDSTRDVIF